MTRAVVARLEELQRRFGQVLRVPLDRGSGTLRATPDRYDVGLRAAVVGNSDERLAIYNRQYWFRLFGVLQQAYRTATALLGAWAFNDLAARFLLAHPPVGHDLGRVVDGFERFVAAEELTGRLPGEALLEAVRIDDAFRAVFHAPEQPVLRLTPADAERLPHARLRGSLAFAMIDETWPLVALRHELPTTLPERPVPLPPPHVDGPRTWAICRGSDGQRVLPLTPVHAELVRLLREHPLAAALGILETRVPPSRVGAVAAEAQRWFADGLRFGFWTGLETTAGPHSSLSVSPDNHEAP